MSMSENRGPLFRDMRLSLGVNRMVIPLDYAFLTLAPASAKRRPTDTKTTLPGRPTGALATSKSLRLKFIWTDGNTGVILAL